MFYLLAKPNPTKNIFTSIMTPTSSYMHSSKAFQNSTKRFHSCDLQLSMQYTKLDQLNIIHTASMTMQDMLLTTICGLSFC